MRGTKFCLNLLPIATTIVILNQQQLCGRLPHSPKARSQRQRWCGPFPPWGKVGMGASRLQFLISKFIITHITIAIYNYYFFLNIYIFVSSDKKINIIILLSLNIQLLNKEQLQFGSPHPILPPQGEGTKLLIFRSIFII